MEIIGTIASSIRVVTGDFESIATVTVSGSSTNTITLSSIPATYKHLMIRSVTAVNSNTPSQAPAITCNNYTGANDYLTYYLVTQDQNNAAPSSFGGSGSSMLFPIHTVGRGAMVQTDYFSGSQIWILDYANTTTFKNLLSTTGFWNTSGSGTESQSRLNISTFRKKEAINQISIFHASNFTANTQVALYGIKG